VGDEFLACLSVSGVDTEQQFLYVVLRNNDGRPQPIQR
jgi:hypothetical protein